MSSQSTIPKENSKSEIEENHSKSLFKKTPKSDNVVLQYFGTLDSLPSLACVKQTPSKLNENFQNSVPNLVSNFSIHKETHEKEASHLYADKQVNVTANTDDELSTNAEGRQSKESFSFLKLKCDVNKAKSNPEIPNSELKANQSKTTSVVSCIHIIQQSIDLFKTENVLTPEEQEQLRLMEEKLVPGLREYEEAKLYLENFKKPSESPENTSTSQLPLFQSVSDVSIGADIVRRVIVCPANCKNIPKVVVCDKSCEVVPINCDMDSESSISAMQDLPNRRQTNFTENSQEMDCNIQFNIELNRESIDVINSDSSFRTSLSHGATDQLSLQRRVGLSAGADDVTSKSLSTDSHSLDSCSLSTQSTRNNITVAENKSCFGCENVLPCQPAGHFHPCCFVNVPNLFSERKCSASGREKIAFPYLADTSNSCTNSCGHKPSESSLVPPQKQLFPNQQTQNQFHRMESGNCCGKKFGTASSHENSRTVLKSLSKCYYDSKNVLRLRALKDEKDKLTKELKAKDLQIFRLKKKIYCLESDKNHSLKTNDDCLLQSNPQNRDEKLYELSNSISTIQKNLDVYCSCFNEDTCNLEKQLEDMEHDVNRIKKDLIAMKCERLEVEAAKATNICCSPGKNSECSDKSETDSFRKTNEHFKLQISDCPSHVQPQDNLCPPSGYIPSNFDCWQNTRENLVNESELNKRICELESTVTMLREKLQRKSCGGKSMLPAENQLRAVSCTACTSRQACGSDDSAELTSMCYNELCQLLKLRKMEVCQLAQELCNSNAAQAELACDVQFKKNQVEELDEKLKDSEGKLCALENDLSQKEIKLCELQKQLSASEKRGIELEKQLCKGQEKTDLQCYENKIKELEEKLINFENEVCTRQNTIKELENCVKSHQCQVSEFQDQVKNCEAIMNAFLENEKQFDLSCAKISSLEEELRKNNETIGTLSDELLKAETKNLDLQQQLKCSNGTVERLQRELQVNKNDDVECQNIHNTQVAALQQQLQCIERQLDEVTCERDSLLKAKHESCNEVKELKKVIKSLESANCCLAKEIVAEVERLKVDLMVKLHNFCPLITSLEMTRSELQEAVALFEDAEKRCCSLNEKLNQTNEELQALKTMKRSATKATKLLHRCSEKSIENETLLAEACEDLNSLNSEKMQLKSAVDALMAENEEKDLQLSCALAEMEDLKREICHLRNLSERKR